MINKRFTPGNPIFDLPALKFFNNESLKTFSVSKIVILSGFYNVTISSYIV